MSWLMLLLACTSPSLDEHCDQIPEGRVTLPDDDAAHDEPVEWWYWTGHLQDGQGRWYGFEQTFFQMKGDDLQGTSAHVALTDVDADRFDYDVSYGLTLYDEEENGFDLELGGQTATGSGGEDRLHAEIGTRGWDLDLSALEAPVLQHGDGFHDYAVGGYTWYYSRERIGVGGTILVDGETRAVTGQAWFDHQWGELNQTASAGWDWFAIQLDDEREIMLFMVRGSDDVIGGSFTDADCRSREVDASELQITSLGEWTSPHSGCTYPLGWQVSVGDLSLELTPVRQDQEVINDLQTYWEGAHEVSGDATGRAYVELAGYCAD